MSHNNPLIGSRNTKIHTPALERRSVLFSIADIQGCAQQLAALRGRIASEFSQNSSGTEKRSVIYLGDYVGPGRDSAGVIDMLISAPLPEVDEIFLLGDRDLDFLNFARGRALSVDWLISRGGLTVLESYGVTVTKRSVNRNNLDMKALRSDLLKKMPSDHITFLESLHLSYEVGNYFFVHAGVNPRYGLNRQSPKDFISIGAKFLNSRRNFDKVIVHGHDSKLMPVERFNRIGLNTDVQKTGVLTAARFSGDEKRFLQVSDKTASTLSSFANPMTKKRSGTVQ